MKLLVCLTLILTVIQVQALSEEQTEKLNKISKECRESSGVSQEVINNARNGNFADDPKLKQQILCVAKKVGIAAESGDISSDVLKNKIKKVAANDEEVDKIFNKCVVKKDTSEETAFETIKCIMKNNPKFSPVD